MEKGRDARIARKQEVLRHVPRSEQATVEQALDVLRAALAAASASDKITS